MRAKRELGRDIRAQRWLPGLSGGEQSLLSWNYDIGGIPCGVRGAAWMDGREREGNLHHPSTPLE